MSTPSGAFQTHSGIRFQQNFVWIPHIPATDLSHINKAAAKLTGKIAS